MKKKTQNFFILINFDADLDYAANVNSGMRQVLCVFPGLHSPSEESQKGCLLEKLLGVPVGAQSTPMALRGKILSLFMQQGQLP